MVTGEWMPMTYPAKAFIPAYGPPLPYNTPLWEGSSEESRHRSFPAGIAEAGETRKRPAGRTQSEIESRVR